MNFKACTDDSKMNDDDDNKLKEIKRDKITYIASTAGCEENDEEENIIFGAEYGDRRQWIEPYKDNARAIFKCIGRVETNYGEIDPKSGNALIQRGTGTVFHVEDGRAWVITCGHNIVKKGDDDNHKHPISIQFTREISKYREPQKYDAEKWEFHPGYWYKDGDNEMVKKEVNDLGIIKIKDKDGFYRRIFAKNRDIVKLFCSDDIEGNSSKIGYDFLPRDQIRSLLLRRNDIKDNSLKIKYNLFGYPCPHDKYSKAEDGRLYGMKALSFKQRGNIY